MYKMLKLLALCLSILLLAACQTGPEVAAPVTTQEPPQEPAAAPAEPVDAPESADAPETAPAEAPEAESEPVVLRVGILADLPCWNPYSCFSNIETNFLLYDRITDTGPEPGCDSVPGLADSWEVSEDGLTWTLHFDEGITFHDGTPFTAQTFVDHIQWVQGTSLAYWYPEVLNIESIEVVDDLTAKYTTSMPISNSPDLNFLWLYVVPPDIYGQYDDNTLWSATIDDPIGTGPYIMSEHVPGQYIIWDAYPAYHRGKPPIDRMVWQIYSNEEALINALLTGEIDSTYIDVSPQYINTLSANKDIAIEERQGGQQLALYFNMAAEGARHPAIADTLLREAVDYAVDKQSIVNIAFLGHGIVCPTNWACGPMFEGEVNPDLEVTPFDIEKAKEILDQAGYRDTDMDGILETADGEPLNFRLFIQLERAEQLTVAKAIEGWLAEVGIQVSTEALEAGTWRNAIGNRDYDLALGYQKPDMDPGVIDWYYSCWSAESGTSGNNHSGYCNEEVDALVGEYWYTNDLEGRWTPMFEAQRIMNQDRPFITLAGKNEIQAYRSDRFTFPTDTCHWAGYITTQGLMNAEIIR